MDDEFERLQTEMQAAFADLEQDELDDLLDEAVKHARTLAMGRRTDCAISTATVPALGLAGRD
ncbi:MAG: hypothetical protein R3E95_01035 [Thiolinea sp.]